MVRQLVGVPAETGTEVTRPPERKSSVAMVFASVMGSDSVGSATDVASSIVVVASAAVANATQGSRVRM